MITPLPVHGVATPLSATPRTESGQRLLHATAFAIDPAFGGAVHTVVVTNYAVYPADSQGCVHDFISCLCERATTETPADAVAHLGYEVRR